MPNIAFYCAEFFEHVTASSIAQPTVSPINAVEFIQTFSPKAKNTLYIGESKMIANAIEQNPNGFEATTFATCDTEVDLAPLAREHSLNVIVTDMDLFTMHSHITHAINDYCQFKITLLETGNETQNIQKLIQTASELSHASVFLLNVMNQVVYSVAREQDRKDLIVREMMTNGKLCQDTLAKMKAAQSRTSKPFGARYPDNDESVFFKFDVSRDDKAFYSVVMVRQSTRPFFDGASFLSMLCDVIDAMMHTEGFRYWAGEDFKSFVEALSDGKFQTTEEIARRLALLPVVPEKFCSFIVIDFEPAGALPDPPAYFITQLKGLFPNSNACIYNNTIVLLYGRPTRFRWKTDSSYDAEKFESLLKQYHACAGISTPMSKLSAFRAELLLAEQVLRLARKLRRSDDERVFFLDDYAEYVMIDLCYPRFVKTFGNDDLIMLSHPDPINLYRYDKANGDNLLEVLYYYCLCDLNVAKTAQMVYMHRNTVATKLKKIESIIVDDISDGAVQARIVLTYRIMRYLERCTPRSLSQRILVQPAPKPRP